MDKDKLFSWLFSERKHGCISSALVLFLLVFIPAFPIITFGTIEHDGIKEPATILLCLEICAPLVSLCLISVSGKKECLSRAYFYSFILIAILSIMYLSYKIFKHEYNYSYFGYDLVKALVFSPIYLGFVSLFFFITEQIVNNHSKNSSNKE